MSLYMGKERFSYDQFQFTALVSWSWYMLPDYPTVKTLHMNVIVPFLISVNVSHISSLNLQPGATVQCHFQLDVSFHPMWSRWTKAFPAVTAGHTNMLLPLCLNRQIWSQSHKQWHCFEEISQNGPGAQLHHFLTHLARQTAEYSVDVTWSNDSVHYLLIIYLQCTV